MCVIELCLRDVKKCTVAPFVASLGLRELSLPGR